MVLDHFVDSIYSEDRKNGSINSIKATTGLEPLLHARKEELNGGLYLEVFPCLDLTKILVCSLTG